MFILISRAIIGCHFLAMRMYVGWAPVAHACNPCYSGGRDQEDHGLKPVWANSSTKPYLKKPFTKTGLVEWLKIKNLSSSPSTTKKKKKVCRLTSQ
jgi:hypothetical protein